MDTASGGGGCFCSPLLHPNAAYLAGARRQVGWQCDGRNGTGKESLLNTTPHPRVGVVLPVPCFHTSADCEAGQERNSCGSVREVTGWQVVQQSLCAMGRSEVLPADE